ncbi:VanZ family protein [Motilimonas eburnea]|uniref:VanZ family protein n=1 Tax=Motilimonas eburnea TaxID=1737488 RepID=UPI001E5D5F5B|nr:VanZ family protein [Motilimonas eburnea]MCE2573787.1 VanZ family protein [Motilimonas eburnea]
MYLSTAAKVTFSLLIIVISYLAFAPAPVQIQINHFDKVNHLAAFASLALVGRFAFTLAPWQLTLWLLGYGALIEGIQAFIPNRFASGFDLLADLIGIGLGLLVYTILAPWLNAALARLGSH